MTSEEFEERIERLVEQITQLEESVRDAIYRGSRASKAVTVHNTYAGETTHRYSDGRVCRFRPTGPLRRYSAAEKAARGNPISRISGGDYSARLFVGLNVGQRRGFTERDVVDIVWKTRKRQGRLGDASILSQKGIYEDRSGKRVVEPSVQVIIIDLAGATKRKFVAEMQVLGEVLRRRLKQETVILEIQRRGVITDVFTIT
jgi:hypothetical protein